MSIESIRAEFEAWITAPPFERSIDRHGQDAAFPGTYRDLYVDVAWCAWSQVSTASAADVMTLSDANSELHGDYLAAAKRCEELQSRVAELEYAIDHAIDYWNRDYNEMAMKDAPCAAIELDAVLDACQGSVADAQEQPAPVPSCEWHEDEDGIWETSCGQSWTFPEGGPEDNDMKFCHQCGKHLIARPQSPEAGHD